MNSDYDPSLYTDDGRFQNDESYTDDSKHKIIETDNFYQLNNAQENQIDASLRRLYALEKYLLDDPIEKSGSELSESSEEAGDSEFEENMENLEKLKDDENIEKVEENSKSSEKGCHDDSYQELFYDRYFNKFFNPESGEYHQD